MPPTVLLSWSGGIDSTSCLWQLLRDGKEVLAHHVRLKNREGREPYEKQAVDAIFEWLRARKLSGGLTYHETGFDYGTVKRIVRDITIMGAVSGFVAAGYPSIKTMVIAGSATDDRRRSIGVARERRRVLAETMAGRSFEWIQPNKSKTKAQVMAEMPPDLLALCWYCRKPRDGKPCGQCHTCREVTAGRRALHASR